MTQKNSNALSSRVMLWAMIAFVCVLLGAGVRLVHGWSDLFSHIMPTGGANIALSTSMEPFDIALKSKVYDNEKGDVNQTVEWDLKVPRAYVDDVQGKNGSVRHLVSTGGQDDFKALLAVHVLADGQTLEPYTMMAANQKKFDDNTMVISVYNTYADWWITQNNLCVPQDKDAEFSQKYNVGLGSDLDCFDSIKLCYFSTQLDGWAITINVTKKLYAQPQKVCAMTKTFLNQYTVKRDYFPIDVPTGYRTTSKQPKAVTP